MITNQVERTVTGISLAKVGVFAYLLLTAVIVALTIGDSLRSTVQNQMLLLGVLTLTVRLWSRTSRVRQANTARFDSNARKEVSSRSYRLWRFILFSFSLLFIATQVVSTQLHLHVDLALLAEVFAVPMILLFLVTSDLFSLWA